MRELTKSQKKLLDNWFKEKEPTEKEKMFFGKQNPITNADALTTEQWDSLTKINDTEILYQEVNRYLMDKVMGD